MIKDITSNREMTCPFCGKPILLGGSVGIIHEEEVIKTEYSPIFIGVKQTNTIRKFSVYGCSSCCHKRSLFDSISTIVYGCLLISWLVFSIYFQIGVAGSVFLLFLLIVILSLPHFVIKRLLKIKKISYSHALKCHAVANV